MVFPLSIITDITKEVLILLMASKPNMNYDDNSKTITKDDIRCAGEAAKVGE